MLSNFMPGSIRTLLCFGDSNTYGMVPYIRSEEKSRFDCEHRWTALLQAHLSESWHVIENGLPGRTTNLNDPERGHHLNGTTGLRIALESQQPIEHLIIMLGTNDLKSVFQSTPDSIAEGLSQLVDIARDHSIPGVVPPETISVISPTPVREILHLSEIFRGAEQKSLALAASIRSLAVRRKLDFLDAGSYTKVSDTDGVHWDQKSHIRFARALAQHISRQGPDTSTPEPVLTG